MSSRTDWRWAVAGLLGAVGVGLWITYFAIRDRAAEHTPTAGTSQAQALPTSSVPAAAPPPQPTTQAPSAGSLTFERAFLDAMAAKGYTLDGPNPPPAAMRDGLATALTAIALDQGLQVAFNVKKTTLEVIVIDGTGCSKQKLAAVVEMAQPALGSAGFTKVKCEPEGYVVPVR